MMVKPCSFRETIYAGFMMKYAKQKFHTKDYYLASYTYTVLDVLMNTKKRDKSK